MPVAGAEVMHCCSAQVALLGIQFQWTADIQVCLLLNRPQCASHCSARLPENYISPYVCSAISAVQYGMFASWLPDIGLHCQSLM